MLDPEKSKGAKNALIHGVYASDVLLPGESEENFSELYRAFRSELNPESPLEEEAVLDIARLHWLKRRAVQAAKGEFRDGQQSLISPLDLASALKAIHEGTNEFDSTLQKIVETLNERLSTISDERLSALPVKETYEACKNLLADLEELQERYVGEIYIKLCEMLDQKLSVERTYHPADLERVMKVEAMIDTRVEKVLARIAGIKEFRRIYRQKQVASGSA